jgi:hypothetical protein
MRVVFRSPRRLSDVDAMLLRAAVEAALAWHDVGLVGSRA